jgi:NRPS condensation-like uncharacterized protein
LTKYKAGIILLTGKKIMANLLKHNPDERYYPLDNSAVFIASITSRSSPYIYRISCELDELIYLTDLEKAFDLTIERFPWFKAELRPGVFWYYLDPLKRLVKLTADSLFPAEYHQLEKGTYLFRVRVYGSRIACEFHHTLTDGTGALEFLRSLIASYLTFRGVVCNDWQDIVRPDSKIDPAEFEDAYALKIRKNIPKPDNLPPAFHLPGKRYTGMTYRITAGTASVAVLQKTAKHLGVSITELLAAVHLFALQSVAESGHNKSVRPICIQVPVNMRRFYPSKTLRNFFLFVPLTLDNRLGHYDLDEIISIVHHSMYLKLNMKEMDRQIRRNVTGENNYLSRIVPLVFKNIVLRMIRTAMSDPPYSGSFSNLQKVSMPEIFADHIKRFDFIPARNMLTGANVGVVSWKDKISISIGSLVVERDFERSFFKSCVGLGIPVTVESNI